MAMSGVGKRTATSCMLNRLLLNIVWWVNSCALLIADLPFHQMPTTFTNSASSAKSSAKAFISCRFQASAKALTTRVTSATPDDMVDLRGLRDAGCGYDVRGLRAERSAQRGLKGVGQQRAVRWPDTHRRTQTVRSVALRRAAERHDGT